MRPNGCQTEAHITMLWLSTSPSAPRKGLYPLDRVHSFYSQAKVFKQLETKTGIWIKKDKHHRSGLRPLMSSPKSWPLLVLNVCQLRLTGSKFMATWRRFSSRNKKYSPSQPLSAYVTQSQSAFPAWAKWRVELLEMRYSLLCNCTKRSRTGSRGILCCGTLLAPALSFFSSIWWIWMNKLDTYSSAASSPFFPLGSWPLLLLHIVRFIGKLASFRGQNEEVTCPQIKISDFQPGLPAKMVTFWFPLADALLFYLDSKPQWGRRTLLLCPSKTLAWSCREYY